MENATTLKPIQVIGKPTNQAQKQFNNAQKRISEVLEFAETGLIFRKDEKGILTPYEVKSDKIDDMRELAETIEDDEVLSYEWNKTIRATSKRTLNEEKPLIKKGN